MKKSNKGFTLIELLVVIAIIAILAAILFPVFAQARAKGREAVCTSNGKQIATAMIMYAQDYDERWVDDWPGYSSGPYNDTHTPRWIPGSVAPGKAIPDFTMKPYLKNTGVLHCPEERTITRQSSPPVVYYSPQYAMNILPPRLNGLTYPKPFGPIILPDGGATGNNLGPGARIIAQFSHPATYAVMWEHNEAEPHCPTWNSAQEPAHWTVYHQGGFLCTFADGHVKRWTPERLTPDLVAYWDLPLN